MYIKNLGWPSGFDKDKPYNKMNAEHMCRCFDSLFRYSINKWVLISGLNPEGGQRVEYIRTTHMGLYLNIENKNQDLAK